MDNVNNNIESYTTIFLSYLVSLIRASRIRTVTCGGRIKQHEQELLVTMFTVLTTALVWLTNHFRHS